MDPTKGEAMNNIGDNTLAGAGANATLQLSRGVLEIFAQAQDQTLEGAAEVMLAALRRVSLHRGGTDYSTAHAMREFAREAIAAVRPGVANDTKRAPSRAPDTPFALVQEVVSDDAAQVMLNALVRIADHHETNDYKTARAMRALARDAIRFDVRDWSEER